jgi:hypothetical protein
MDFDQAGTYYLFNIKEWRFSKNATLISQDHMSSFKNIIIYPNPASDYLVVKSNEKRTLEIYSIYGQLLKRKELQFSTNYIPLEDILYGEYILKIKNKREVYSEKLIINNNR